MNKIALGAVSTILAVALITAYFSQLTFPNRTAEAFSELAILGPEMKLEGYPTEISVNQTFRLHLYVGNHEGRTEYYKILVKFTSDNIIINETIPAEVGTKEVFETILVHGENITVPMDLKINEATMNGRLIFEMWILQSETLQFKYYGKWCQLWLNITEQKI